MRNMWPWLAGAGIIGFALFSGGSNDTGTEPPEGEEGSVGVGKPPPPPAPTPDEPDKPQPKAPAKRAGHDPPPVKRAGSDPEKRVVYTANGEPASAEFSVPSGRVYKVVVTALTPDIGAFIKLGGKEYGIGWGPPQSAPVLDAIVNAVNGAVSAGVKVGSVTPNLQITAIATAIETVNSIVAKIPDLLAKARVKAWALFRAGKWGTKTKRNKIKARLKQWYSTNYQSAKKMGRLRGAWDFKGDFSGEWPMTDFTPGVDNFLANDIPTVFAEKVGDYWRVIVETAEISNPVEIRYQISIQAIT